MNDTIFNSRQKQVLKLLKDKGALSRSELSQLIVAPKGTSRITVIRDLNALVKAGAVVVRGKGRATRYSLERANPLLEYIDMDNYFAREMDERSAKPRFNDGVFTNLAGLYSKDEIDLWEKGAEEFKKRREKLDRSIYKRELERFVIELSWKSSQIEGNTYSLIETETLIKENIQARGHSKEEATMILNHKHAFDMILDEKDTFKRLEFTDVVQMHNVLVKGLVTTGIRSQKVRITGTRYEPMSSKDELENALRKLIRLVNETNYPPEKALILAAMVAYIQPFADGNKRMARMLANAVLIAYDYFPLSYRNVDVNDYRNSMIIFYETNNLFCLKRIFMSQLEFAVSNYFRA